MKNKIKKIALLGCSGLLLSTVLSACIDEGGYDRSTTTEPSKDVKMTLLMSTAAPAGTYAISEVDENEVATIDVLSFVQDASKTSGWAFDYQSEGSAIADVSSNNSTRAKKQFTITLIKKPNVQRLVVLANVHASVAGLGSIPKGADKDSLLACLTLSNPGSWNANNTLPDNDPAKTFTPFPMWGETEETVSDNTTQLTGIQMLRGIARMDVVLGADVISAGKFLLNTIYIYNSKQSGRIVPNPANMVPGANRVKAATLPTGNINNTTPLSYTVPTAMNKAFERTIYLFEAGGTTADLAAEATCLVVGGTYGNDTSPTYYRVDIPGRTVTESFYRDILRNHHYRVNILNVTGRGYSSKEEAFGAKGFNLVAEIKEFNDADMGEVVFDGQYTLSASQGLFSFFRYGKSGEETDNVLYVETDYDVAPNSGWKIEKIVDATDGTTPITWLTADTTTGVAHRKTKVVLTFSDNQTSGTRTADIILTAGLLRCTVRVSQSNVAPLSLAVVNGADDEISELEFNYATGLTSQQFTVNWTPKTSDLTIGNTPGTIPVTFPGMPANGTVISGAAGTGKVTYTVTPPAFTTAELEENPFIEKETQLTFSVSNTVSTATKNLLLKQVNYTVVPMVSSYYPLNESPYSFVVKSNATWKIRSVTENLTQTSGTATLIDQEYAKNTLKAGTIGGNNIMPGDKIQFKTGYMAPIAGTVTIVFESVDTPKKFDDITVSFSMSGSYYPTPHRGWAGSHIYWNGTKLTFDDVNDKQHEQYQGVFFKWGSLTGISPAGDYSTTTTLYPPEGGTTSGLYWDAIPRVGDNEFLGIDYTGRNYLYELNTASGIGDICKFLTIQAGGSLHGKQWRMPTIKEFGAQADYTFINNGATALPTNAAGTTSISSGIRNTTSVGTPFFSGGSMIDMQGKLSLTGMAFFGNLGLAWSSSPNRESGDRMYFYVSYNAVSILSLRRSCALPVRCVVE